MRFKFIDVLLYTLVFIFVAAFPIDLIPVSEVYKGVILIGLKLFLLGVYIWIIAKNRIKIFGIASYSTILLCIPFFIACFSNMIASKIDGTVGPITMSGSMLAINIVICALTAVTEEILFRLFIHNSLTKVGSFGRILGSAGIFAAMHLINLANVSSVDALVTVLVQVVYDFGLGLMLGFMYEYSHSITSCFILHFSFNLFNQVLVNYFAFNSSMLCFYLTAIVIGAILLAYGLCLYFFRYKKMDRFFRN